MTQQAIQNMIADLREVRAEITRINRATGFTAFNPAATQALETSIEILRDMLVAA